MRCSRYCAAVAQHKIPYRRLWRKLVLEASAKYLVGQLTSAAQTRTQVRTAFVQSPEFQGRVNAVIAAGCFP